jgi:hypothetical protein
MSEAPKRGRGRPKGSKNKRPSIEGRLGFRVNEVASAIGVSRAVISNLIGKGEIKVVYVGLMPIVPRAEMQRLLTPTE